MGLNKSNCCTMTFKIHVMSEDEFYKLSVFETHHGQVSCLQKTQQRPALLVYVIIFIFFLLYSNWELNSSLTFLTDMRNKCIDRTEHAQEWIISDLLGAESLDHEYSQTVMCNSTTSHMCVCTQSNTFLMTEDAFNLNFLCQNNKQHWYDRLIKCDPLMSRRSGHRLSTCYCFYRWCHGIHIVNDSIHFNRE